MLTDLEKQQIADDFHLSLNAHGGLTNFYQSARALFDYSGELQKPFHPNDLQRATWLHSMIHHLEMLHSQQLRTRDFSSAIQTRQLIGTMLDELGSLIEKPKKL